MMKKLHLLLLFLLAFTIANAQDFPTSTWSDLADTSWYVSTDSEFTISTAEQLAGISQLVASGTTFAGKTITIASNIDLDGNLWTPIGAYPALFSGNVEGNNNTISNLWVNLPEKDFAGLFGYTSNSTFSNLQVDTAHIIGFDSVGTLVANLFDNGSIENCSAINISVTGNNNTGGLVGGIVTNSIVSKSHAIGDVTGSSQVGGLAGSGWDKIQVIECYSKGTVTANFLGGGLVGAFPFSFGAQSIIDNSYSRSLINVDAERAGGITGGADNALLIKNSYSTGTVNAFDVKGAIIGLFGGGIQIENVYFDTESSGMTDGVGAFGGTPSTPDITSKTTAEMKAFDMVDLLNADNVDGPWSIDSTVNEGYPILTSVLAVTDHEIDVTSVTIFPSVADNEINISSSVDLKTYSIYNLLGALVSKGNLNGLTSVLSVDYLSSGMYIMKINTEYGSITRKFIKR